MRPAASKSSSEEQESSESADAPMRRRPRAPRELPVDERQELHNSDLAQWKADYLDNMATATEIKKNHKAYALAKKNAEYWVMGAGIGGVGTGIGASKLKSPLDMFAGSAMMEALTGIQTLPARQKRARDKSEDQESDSETRRVRMRDGDGEQIGRGDEMTLNEDDTMMYPVSEV